MTTDAVSAAMIPLRPAWRSLLWTVPFTVLWTWLIYSLPVLPESGLPALTVRLMVHGLIVLGLWLGLERTDLTPNQRRTTWLAIMVPFTLWAAVAWTAAINGVFRTGASPLPLLPSAIFLPVIIGAPLLLLSKRVGQLLDAMPTTWLVALQLYRVFGSQWLAYWLLGLLPGLWALPAGTGDVLTGLFAVPAAIALATGATEGRRAAMLWNIFGIADLVGEIAQGAAHLVGLEIALERDDIESRALEHRSHRAGVVRRVREQRDVLIGRIAKHQRHPLLGEGGLAQKPHRANRHDKG